MALELKVCKTENPKAKPADESKLGFGRVFSDHMFVMDWTKDKGWHDAKIIPYGYLSISPASSVLHYGSEIFEGLKAYRNVKGEIVLFRPQENLARMNRSAERLGLPEFPSDFVLDALKKLRALLAENDLLLLMSDGIADAFPAEEDILDLVRRRRNDSPQHIADALLHEAVILKDGLPPDDMTVLCARVTDRKGEAA